MHSVVAAGSLALILVCVLDASTALELALTMKRSDRNSYGGVRCEDGAGGLASGATLMLNATTPPTDCFNVTILGSGEMNITFTTSCEGFLQCCKDDGCSSSHKLEAYPLFPPVTTKIELLALAGQIEPIILRSNVQGSNTGQISVMWVFAETSTAGNTVMLSPNGDKNSLLLSNLTTADTGEYYPVATATSSSLMVVNWRIVTGQRYFLQVDNFDQPRFTRNLTCSEEPEQMWRCTTQATGTDIMYYWFMNNVRLTTDDNRVSSMIRSTIVLHNLEASDTHLTVQIHSMKNQHMYRIAQSAAILVPSRSFCPTTESSNGSCLLPWLPILCGIIFCLALVLIGLIACLCLYHHSHQRNDATSTDIDGIEAVDYKRNRLHLDRDDLEDSRCVMNWLSSVIRTLDSDVARNNHELHDVLTQLNIDLENYRNKQPENHRSIQDDGDDDDDEDEDEGKVDSLIKHLKQILTIE